MENTLENKKKLFAQYWGQRVFNNGLMGDNTVWDFTGSNHDDVDGGDFTILKTLSSITDEDAIQIARIITRKKLQSDIQFWINDVKKELETTAPIGVWRIEVFQYLQSKGYALPFMGLSVDKMVEYGWIKLKTNS